MKLKSSNRALSIDKFDKKCLNTILGMHSLEGGKNKQETGESHLVTSALIINLSNIFCTRDFFFKKYKIFEFTYKITSKT